MVSMNTNPSSMTSSKFRPSLGALFGLAIKPALVLAAAALAIAPGASHAGLLDAIAGKVAERFADHQVERWGDARRPVSNTNAAVLVPGRDGPQQPGLRCLPPSFPRACADRSARGERAMACRRPVLEPLRRGQLCAHEDAPRRRGETRQQDAFGCVWRGAHERVLR